MKKIGLSKKRAGVQRGPMKGKYAIKVESDPVAKKIGKQQKHPRFSKRHRG